MLKSELPDITTESCVKHAFNLQWVGMEGIAIPLKLNLYDALTHTFNAKASIYVDLDNMESKGIHMSRLHKVINKLSSLKCDKESLDSLLEQSISSQNGISKSARIRLEFDLILEKSSLLSQNVGYQSYSIVINSEANAQSKNYEIEVTIPYSSSCPCSASLARQLYANAIDARFPEALINKKQLTEWINSEGKAYATPHSQRSYAYIKIKLGENLWPNIKTLIFQLEEVIGTPLQTVVKRSDEQEFARLNGENLMFCEDAARRIKKCLEEMPFAENYCFKVEHQESLHAHNAVVIDQKYT